MYIIFSNLLALHRIATLRRDELGQVRFQLKLRLFCLGDLELIFIWCYDAGNTSELVTS